MAARQWTKGPKSGVDGRVLSRLEAVNSPAAGDRCMSRAIMAALRSVQLGQPPAVTAAYAATARSLIAVITVLNEQVKALESQVEADFGHHPDAEIYLSQPGLGPILARPGPRRVRRRPAPLRQRQSPQELRRHLPAHPRLGQEEDGHGPVHPQRPAHRCADRPGPVRPGSLAWRPGPLRRRARPRHRAPQPCCASSPTGWSASSTAASRPAPSTTRQPPGRTGKRPLNQTSPLDTKAPGMSFQGGAPIEDYRSTAGVQLSSGPAIRYRGGDHAAVP